VDQICINQLDADERGEQVTNISRIFQAASEVVVWLGTAADGSDRVMDVWTQIGAMAQQFDVEEHRSRRNQHQALDHTAVETKPQDSTAMQFESIIDQTLQLPDRRTLNAIVAWEKRRWFSRVWVVQEYALSKEAIVMCGKKTLLTTTAESGRELFVEAVKRLPPDLLSICLPLFQDPMHVFAITRAARRPSNDGKIGSHTLYELLRLLFTNNHV